MSETKKKEKKQNKISLIYHNSSFPFFIPLTLIMSRALMERRGGGVGVAFAYWRLHNDDPDWELCHVLGRLS